MHGRTLQTYTLRLLRLKQIVTVFLVSSKFYLLTKNWLMLKSTWESANAKADSAVVYWSLRRRRISNSIAGLMVVFAFV